MLATTATRTIARRRLHAGSSTGSHGRVYTPSFSFSAHSVIRQAVPEHLRDSMTPFGTHAGYCSIEA
ncbi:MAG TPA: hypothetical protein VMY78_15370 [Solirubrobacteraceae bacterium]|nr:hypothetical protein [Solirubrobacteraceae bacterium]